MTTLTSPRRQHGAALMVCLIILVLVTLMGLTTMRTSVLQEKMSGASSDKTLALQAAELGLRDAERRIRDSLTSTSGFAANCAASLCLPADGTMKSDTINWNTAPLALYGAGTGSPAVAGVARQPRYIIELLYDMKPPLGNSENIKLKGTPYRITAIGYGKLERTQVVLQSVYYQP